MKKSLTSLPVSLLIGYLVKRNTDEIEKRAS